MTVQGSLSPEHSDDLSCVPLMTSNLGRRGLKDQPVMDLIIPAFFPETIVFFTNYYCLFC